jgi:hypothetical protein
MNDAEIRKNFHRKELRRQHLRNDTLVIDELGLCHGKCRADIAVVNGHLIGYEIKSNKDSLRRLEEQIISYNSVFDKVSIIVGNRYGNSIRKYIPKYWGIIISVKGLRGAVNFEIIRKADINKNTNPVSIARLLWRDEVIEILQKNKIPNKILRKPRAVLYEYLVDTLSACELRQTVRDCFKKRRNWRCPELLSRYGGLYQPPPTL